MNNDILETCWRCQSPPIIERRSAFVPPHKTKFRYVCPDCLHQSLSQFDNVEDAADCWNRSQRMIKKKKKITSCLEIAQIEQADSKSESSTDRIPEWERSIYQRAIEIWGQDAQIRMVVEELSELIVAVCQYERKRIPVYEVASEIADVEIMLEQLRSMLGSEKTISRLVTEKKLAKLRRLEERLTDKVIRRNNK